MNRRSAFLVRSGIVSAALLAVAQAGYAVDQYTVSSLPLPAGMDPVTVNYGSIEAISPDGKWLIVEYSSNTDSRSYYRYNRTSSSISQVLLPTGYTHAYLPAIDNNGTVYGSASILDANYNTSSQVPCQAAVGSNTLSFISAVAGGIETVDANGVRYGYFHSGTPDYQNYQTARPVAWPAGGVGPTDLLAGTSLANVMGYVNSSAQGLLSTNPDVYGIYLAGFSFNAAKVPRNWVYNVSNSTLYDWAIPTGPGLLPPAYGTVAGDTQVYGFVPKGGSNSSGLIYTVGVQDDPTTPSRTMWTTNLYAATKTHQLVPLPPGTNQANSGNAELVNGIFTLVQQAMQVDATGNRVNNSYTQFIWEAGSPSVILIKDRVINQPINSLLWGGPHISSSGEIVCWGQDVAAVNGGPSGRINILTPATTVNVSASAASTAENGGAVTFTINRGSRVGTLDAALTVPLAVSGSAVVGTDFTLSGGSIVNGLLTVVIPKAASSTTVVVTPKANPASYVSPILTLTPAAPNQTSPDKYQTGKAFINGTAATVGFTNIDVPATPMPTITRLGSGTVPGNATVNLTVDFAKPVSGFVDGELTASIGTLSPLSGSGQIYTTTWTPPQGSQGTVAFNIAAGVANATADNAANIAASPLIVAYDGLPPTASPVSLSQWSDSGISSSDGLTNNTFPLFTGTTNEANTTVTLFVDGSNKGTYLTNGIGSLFQWYISAYGNPLADGPHTASATVVDAAGNLTTTPIYNFTIDTVPPAITSTATSGVKTTASSTTWTGTVEAGATVQAQVTISGSPNFATIETAQVNGTSWSVQIPVGPGSYQVQFVATDAAGNLSTTPAVGLTVASTQVTNFVTRFYQQCLNRSPDQAGLDDWAGQLGAGTRTGASLATGFVLSQEFLNRNLDNGTFVDTLYQAFFNRAADAGGKQGWLDQLNAGAPREDILNGFLFAQEFANLCTSYNITNYSAVDAQKKQIRDFVRRFYQQTLNREPDAAGAGDWTQQLFAGSRTGATLANGFVDSLEFKNRNLNDDQFLAVMYKAFFDRAGDAGGLATWKAQLAAGKTRLEVVYGFTHAQEFINLCANYGITPFSAGG